MNTLAKKLITAAILIFPLQQVETSVYAQSTNQIKEDIYSNLPFEMPIVQQPHFSDYSVNIKDFGAKGDGTTLNTQAINNAIKSINAKGGGTVIIPKGVWLTGPIILLSNVNLYTEKNALVLFTNDFNAYPIIKTSFEGMETRRCQSPISAWVDTPTGEDWFLHFQDIGAYGRVVHLQPMKWINDWPVIGIDKNGDECGEPVMVYKKPSVGKYYPICTPQESDEFDGYTLSPQWQWQANINEKWAYFAGDKGFVRLYSYPVVKEYKNLWDVANLLLQKTPSNNFTATMKLTFRPCRSYYGERTGLVVMGMNYAGLILENTEKGVTLSQITCIGANKGKPEAVNEQIALENNTAYLRVRFNNNGENIKGSEGGYDLLTRCEFSYSLDGEKFTSIGKTFQAKEGQWIGAKVGMADGKRWTNLNADGTICNDPAQLAAMNANTTMWSPLTDRMIFTDWAVEDGSFLRLNTLTLGYTIPSSLLQKVKITSLRFYVTGYNLFCLTSYSGYDPEVSTIRNTNLTPGVDYSAYPKSRQFVVGVNLNF